MTARSRRALDIYFSIIALSTVLYTYDIVRFSRTWAISDWLVNYEGGFVRRGFAGQIAFLLGHVLHITPVFFVIFFCLALYGIILVAMRSFALRSSMTVWVIALLLSPATLAFQILDMSAGFRKELIFLAALALFLWLLRKYRVSGIMASLYISGAVVAGTLSHEPLICFVPYFAAALLISGRTFRQTLIVCLLPALLGLSAAYASATHIGNRSTAEKICSSLGYKLSPPGREICSGGAIAYIGRTSDSARQEVEGLVQERHYLYLYPFLAFVALAPAFSGSLSLSRAGWTREVVWLWSLAGVSFCGSLILFVFAEDWGRWIYIHILSIALLMVFLDGRTSPETRSEKVLSPQPALVAVLCLFLYATCWTLPGAASATPYFGYGGLVHHILARRGAQ